MSTESIHRVPAASVTPDLRHAFGGVWRLTVRRLFVPMRWVLFAGLLALLLVVTAGNAPWRSSPGGYFEWIGGFYIAFLVPIFAFISAAGTMRDDLKPESVDYVFTRPIQRPAFLVFRYLSQMACAQLDFLIVFIALVALGLAQGVSGLWAAIPLLLLCQVMVTTAFSALGFLSGMLTSRYIVIGLAYGALIEVGMGNMPTQLSRFSMTRQVRAVLEPLSGGPGAENAGSAFGATVWLLTAAVVAIALTAAILRTRELAGAQGRDA